MRYLVTGDAGFVGFHVARHLLGAGHEVLGIDGLTDYYDVSLKHRRLHHLLPFSRFRHCTLMLEEKQALIDTFRQFSPDVVVHLAAQAGVRYSLENPDAYIKSNIVGTYNILEACRAHPVQHLLFASTSSAYGANEKYPYSERDPSIHPITLYAASKISSEMMAHCYSHLFSIPTTAFRFFTVYGPWGRPDMAYFIFTQKILQGQPIELFNNGESWRDFTFVDDLVQSILKLNEHPPPRLLSRKGTTPIPGDTLSPAAPYRLVNIGGGQPAKLTELVAEIESAVGAKAVLNLLPLPPGDVVKTFADSNLLFHITGHRPHTPLSVGVPKFVQWYLSEYH